MLISKDLIAASTVPLILSILECGESYGYEIIKRVRELSNGELEWTEGMLYPVLHRLEEQKLIESYWSESETGRKRKYYHISQAGREELSIQKTRWAVVSETLERSWGKSESRLVSIYQWRFTCSY
jgi:DNA-binding PadR family transcriptional regulator